MQQAAQTPLAVLKASQGYVHRPCRLQRLAALTTQWSDARRHSGVGRVVVQAHVAFYDMTAMPI
jgi:hypothetical protein